MPKTPILYIILSKWMKFDENCLNSPIPTVETHFLLKFLFILINKVIPRSYEKKPSRNIETLCQKRQYWILFYRYEWSSIKTVESHIYRPPRLFFRYFLYIMINIVLYWSYQKKPARNIKTLCRKRQYCILFYRYEWSSMKIVRIHLYLQPRLIFR